MQAEGFFYGENGTTRAQLGVAELMRERTGAETRYPAAVVLFDADGKVIWKAPLD